MVQKEIIQPEYINTILKSKYSLRKIEDEFGWTGEYRLSPKDIVDLIIDLTNNTQMPQL